MRSWKTAASVAFVLAVAVTAVVIARDLGPVGVSGDDYRRGTALPSADATVSSDLPETPLGTEPWLRADLTPERRSYLRFRLPAGSTLVAATLQLYVRGSSDGFDIVAVDGPWRESSITFETAPPLGEVIASAPAVADQAWVAVAIPGHAAGDGVLSLAIVPTSDRRTEIASREAERPPRLDFELGTTARGTAAAPAPIAPPGRDPTIVAAGDIACEPGAATDAEDECQMAATAELVQQIGPTAVLALGDTQYEVGGLEAYLGSYDRTWGAFKPITSPAPGNHEYETADATGYYSYFGEAAGDPEEGYYSFDIGTWHLIALNSNCEDVGGCEAGSPQEQWLRDDLSAHLATCVLAYWHHPRFSSGSEHGDDDRTAALWDALAEARADIILNGHDHNYERFAPQNPAGKPTAAGIREFVVGTGGKDVRPMGELHATSEASYAEGFGVLMITLHDGSYTWRYITVDGAVPYQDAGTTTCSSLG